MSGDGRAASFALPDVPRVTPREMPDTLYLDANASAPPLPEALAALQEAALVGANPSSPHARGRAARRVLDVARRHVASALGGSDKEVLFTSGASEANRWLVDALVARASKEGRSLKVVSSPLEHPSLAKPLARAADTGALSLTLLAVTPEGALVLDDAALAEADAVLLTAAHNETGLVPALDEVLARVSPSCIVAVDGAQAVARLPPVPARVDAVVSSAHKMGGLPGAGALLLRGNARELAAPWAGGGQEGGRRPGTEALPLLAAFGAAAAVVERTRAETAALAPLRDALEEALLAAWPGATVIGQKAPRLANTSAITLADVDGDALRMAIDRVGVCVGFGSACSALAPEPSPALIALGLSRERARATVRLSLAPGADRALVDEAVIRLTRLF